jgi:hypothetical protein
MNLQTHYDLAITEERLADKLDIDVVRNAA